MLIDMAEEHHDRLLEKFLPRLAKEANERKVVCGNVTHKQWISKTVSKGMKMSYVFPKTIPARIEMWICHGKEVEDVEAAHEVFKHFLSKKTEIEASRQKRAIFLFRTRASHELREEGNLFTAPRRYTCCSERFHRRPETEEY